MAKSSFSFNMGGVVIATLAIVLFYMGTETLAEDKKSCSYMLDSQAKYDKTLEDCIKSTGIEDPAIFADAAKKAGGSMEKFDIEDKVCSTLHNIYIYIRVWY